MKDIAFHDLVKKHFRYPLDDFRFSVVSQPEEPSLGNQLIAFTSGSCIIGFILDKNEAYIKVASANIVGSWTYAKAAPWFDIGVVIAVLRQEMPLEELVDFYPALNRALPRSVLVDRQLEALAKKTHPYWDRVIELAKSGILKAYEEDFDRLEQRRSDEIYRRIQEQVKNKK